MSEASIEQTGWDDIPLEKVADGMHRRIVTGERMTVARIYFEDGFRVPKHSHEHEQITQVISGTLRFWFGEERRQVARDVVHAPEVSAGRDDDLALPGVDGASGQDEILGDERVANGRDGEAELREPRRADAAVTGQDLSHDERAERDRIAAVLKQTGGNRTKAAELLGTSRVTLWKKIRKYGVQIPK